MSTEHNPTFKGWAVVELFGHGKIAGMVTAEAFGAAVMFRVDVPALPERDYTLETPQYAGGVWCDAGTKVKRLAKDGYTRLVGVGAIFAINPCSELLAMRAVEELQNPEIKVLEMPAAARALVGNRVRVLKDGEPF